MAGIPENHATDSNDVTRSIHWSRRPTTTDDQRKRSRKPSIRAIWFTVVLDSFSTCRPCDGRVATDLQWEVEERLRCERATTRPTENVAVILDGEPVTIVVGIV